MNKRRGDILEGIVMCAPVTDEEREADVVRFLEQATLGPTEALVQEVKAKGIENWLDEQIPMNVTKYTQLPYFYTFEPGTVCTDDPTPPITPEKFCETNRRFSRPVAWEFFRQSKTAPDQLRMRMAHVWHQIFVVGVHNHTYAIAEYQQRLRDGAFSTFDNLLAKYALSPQLGDFQNWIKNLPEQNGIKPNENFARELMQLFTIGVNELNEDGTPGSMRRGSASRRTGRRTSSPLARVLTGFSYPAKPGLNPEFYTVWPSYFGDMLPYDTYHDQGAKSLLGGRLTLPAGGGAMAEVKAALRVLIEHPNTPPFIASNSSRRR